MTREALKHGAVNLSQGFPDFAAPEDIKRVAMQAIADDINQYAITWGAQAIFATRLRARQNGISASTSIRKQRSLSPAVQPKE